MQAWCGTVTGMASKKANGKRSRNVQPTPDQLKEMRQATYAKQILLKESLSKGKSPSRSTRQRTATKRDNWANDPLAKISNTKAAYGARVAGMNAAGTSPKKNLRRGTR